MVLAMPFAVQSGVQMGLIQLDRLVIGRLGEAAIAGVGLGAQIVSFASWTLGALAAACGVLALPAIGAGDHAATERHVRTALRLSILCAILAAAGLAAGAEPILGAMGARGEVAEVARAYLAVEALSLPMAIAAGLAGALRAWQKDMFAPVAAGLGALIVKLVSGVVLVFGTPFTPALGVPGVALAECAARAAQCAILWAVERRARAAAPSAPVVFSRASFVGSTNVRALVAEAAPIATDVVLWQGTSLAYVAMFEQAGTGALAAYQVVLASRLLTLVPPSAISRSAPTLVGHAVGQRKARRARAVAYRAVLLAAGVSVIVGALLAIASPAYVGLYEISTETAHTAVSALALYGLVLPFEAINIVSGPILRVQGGARFVLVVGAITFGGIGIAGGLVATRVFHAGVIGLFAVVYLESVVKALVLLRRIRRGAR